MKRPNIIFIVLDTFRADKLLTNYNDICLTPFIKSILKNSIFFENCISNSPWTLPSHNSMFTGLSPTQLYTISKKIDMVSEKTPIITEILRNLGYYTVCFTENAFISSVYGLTRGFDKKFDVWDWNPWVRQDYPLSQIIFQINKIDKILKRNNKIVKILDFFWDHFKVRALNIVKNLIKNLFLKEILFKLKNETIKDIREFKNSLTNLSLQNPYYLFFNFITPHDPYVGLREIIHKFRINVNDFKKIREMLIFPLKTRFNLNLKSKSLTKEQQKIIKKLYASCVYSSDIVLKELFSNLKEMGLLENSYIIITSDHGEHLGDEIDHNLWEHSTYRSVYESLLRVPLIIYNKNFEQKIIKEQVQLKDLFHTILHLTGQEYSKTPYLEIEKSMTFQIKNKSTPKYIFGEYLKPKKDMKILIDEHRRALNPKVIPIIYNHIYFLRSNEKKLILYDTLNRDEFFDLINDPYEKNNIFNEDNEECMVMKSKIKEILQSMEAPENLKYIITKKEKQAVKKIISKINLDGL